MEEAVRNRSGLVLILIIVIVGVTCAFAQRAGEGSTTGEEFVGVWSGTWEGAGGNGGFELTLEKPKEGAVTGKVSVTGEPTYKAAFTTLSFDGKKLNAKYDFPPDPQGQVVLAATFDGNNAKGAWSLRAKATDAEVATGTWSVTRK
jgi:hypothetical protein